MLAVGWKHRERLAVRRWLGTVTPGSSPLHPRPPAHPAPLTAAALPRLPAESATRGPAEAPRIAGAASGRAPRWEGAKRRGGVGGRLLAVGLRGRNVSGAWVPALCGPGAWLALSPAWGPLCWASSAAGCGMDGERLSCGASPCSQRSVSGVYIGPVEKGLGICLSHHS